MRATLVYLVKLWFDQLANSVCGSGSHTPLEDRQACLSDEECEYIDTTCQNPVVFILNRKRSALAVDLFYIDEASDRPARILCLRAGIATRDKVVIAVPLSM